MWIWGNTISAAQLLSTSYRRRAGKVGLQPCLVKDSHPFVIQDWVFGVP